MIEYETTLPSDGGCAICWIGAERGLMVQDPKTRYYVHKECLDWFGVDSLRMWEKQYFEV